MKPLKIATAATIAAAAALSFNVTSASAYQCSSGYKQVQVHKPTRVASRRQARKSWTYRVKNDLGLAWSVWKIAQSKSVSCDKAGQRWVCVARAKPCLYTVQ